MHIGDRIRIEREAINMEPRELADKVGVAYTTLKDLESGRQKTTTKLHRFADFFGVFAEWLETGRGPKHPTPPSPGAPRPVAGGDNDMVFVTRCKGAMLSAGSGRVTFEYEQIDNSHAFKRQWMQDRGLRAKDCKILDVIGDSMAPELNDGDVVMINLADQKLVNGEVYAIGVGDELRIKRIFRNADGSLDLVSDNPDKRRYPVENVRGADIEQLVVIGRKVWRAG